MRKSVYFLLIALGLITNVFAQNLLQERIRKITPKKLSKFFDRGIFHNGDIKIKTTLKGIRHSFNAQKGIERIVLDFKGARIPRIYGYISKEDRKVNIDLFDTKLSKKIGSFGKSKLVKGINFFTLSEKRLSVEMHLTRAMPVDIFYLEQPGKPGRLIFDIKKL